MDRSNITGELRFHHLAAFTEFGRNLIQERSAAGRVDAKARGHLGGLPEKDGEFLERQSIDIWNASNLIIKEEF